MTKLQAGLNEIKPGIKEDSSRQLAATREAAGLAGNYSCRSVTSRERDRRASKGDRGGARAHQPATAERVQTAFRDNSQKCVASSATNSSVTLLVHSLLFSGTMAGKENNETQVPPEEGHQGGNLPAVFKKPSVPARPTKRSGLRGGLTSCRTPPPTPVKPAGSCVTITGTGTPSS